MKKDLSVEEQDALLLASLTQETAQVTRKEQQNTQLKALLAEKKQLTALLARFSIEPRP